MALSEHQLEDALEDARRQGLPHDWMLSLDEKGRKKWTSPATGSSSVRPRSFAYLQRALDHVNKQRGGGTAAKTGNAGKASSNSSIAGKKRSIKQSGSKVHIDRSTSSSGSGTTRPTTSTKKKAKKSSSSSVSAYPDPYAESDPETSLDVVPHEHAETNTTSTSMSHSSNRFTGTVHWDPHSLQGQKVGHRIRVWDCTDSFWKSGRIVRYDPTSHKHKIVFFHQHQLTNTTNDEEEYQEEWLSLDRENVQLGGRFVWALVKGFAWWPAQILHCHYPNLHTMPPARQGGAKDLTMHLVRDGYDLVEFFDSDEVAAVKNSPEVLREFQDGTVDSVIRKNKKKRNAKAIETARQEEMTTQEVRIDAARFYAEKAFQCANRSNKADGLLGVRVEIFRSDINYPLGETLVGTVRLYSPGMKKYLVAYDLLPGNSQVYEPTWVNFVSQRFKILDEAAKQKKRYVHVPTDDDLYPFLFGHEEIKGSENAGGTSSSSTGVNDDTTASAVITSTGIGIGIKCRGCVMKCDPNHDIVLKCSKCKGVHHPGCLDPPMPMRAAENLLKSDEMKEWTCNKCVRCVGCRELEIAFGPKTVNSHPPSLYLPRHTTLQLCDSCIPMYEKDSFCPICAHVWDDARYRKIQNRLKRENKNMNGGGGSSDGVQAQQSRKEIITSDQAHSDNIANPSADSNSSGEDLVDSSFRWNHPDSVDNSSFYPEKNVWGYNEGTMLGCEKCNLWVHAGCAQLTKDEYEKTSRGEHHIYSREFLCRSCCKEKCLSLMTKLVEEDTMYLFAAPVTDQVAHNYRDIIDNPMDLQTMSERAHIGNYRNYAWLREAFELMVYDALLFNPAHSKYWEEARRFYLACKKNVFAKEGKGAPPSKYKAMVKERFDLAEKMVQAEKDRVKADETAEKKDLVAGDQVLSVKLGQLVKSCDPPSCVPTTIVRMSPVDAFYSTWLECCFSCGSSGALDTMLFCVDCGEGYHSFCASAPIRSMNNAAVDGWRCPNCKLDEITGEVTEDELKLLYCEMCDRAFSIDKISPLLDTPPSGLWICGQCVDCATCKNTIDDGIVSRNFWSRDPSLCLPCGGCDGLELACVEKGKCRVCKKISRSTDGLPKCSTCNFYIHLECDATIGDAKTLESASSEQGKDNKYSCPKCRKRAAKALKRKSERAKAKESAKSGMKAPPKPKRHVPSKNLTKEEQKEEALAVALKDAQSRGLPEGWTCFYGSANRKRWRSPPPVSRVFDSVPKALQYAEKMKNGQVENIKKGKKAKKEVPTKPDFKFFPLHLDQEQDWLGRESGYDESTSLMSDAEVMLKLLESKIGKSMALLFDPAGKLFMSSPHVHCLPQWVLARAGRFVRFVRRLRSRSAKSKKRRSTMSNKSAQTVVCKMASAFLYSICVMFKVDIKTSIKSWQKMQSLLVPVDEGSGTVDLTFEIKKGNSALSTLSTSAAASNTILPGFEDIPPISTLIVNESFNISPLRKEESNQAWLTPRSSRHNVQPSSQERQQSMSNSSKRNVAHINNATSQPQMRASFPQQSVPKNLPPLQPPIQATPAYFSQDQYHSFNGYNQNTTPYHPLAGKSENDFNIADALMTLASPPRAKSSSTATSNPSNNVANRVQPIESSVPRISGSQAVCHGFSAPIPTGSMGAASTQAPSIKSNTIHGNTKPLTEKDRAPNSTPAISMRTSAHQASIDKQQISATPVETDVSFNQPSSSQQQSTSQTIQVCTTNTEDQSSNPPPSVVGDNHRVLHVDGKVRPTATGNEEQVSATSTEIKPMITVSAEKSFAQQTSNCEFQESTTGKVKVVSSIPSLGIVGANKKGSQIGDEEKSNTTEIQHSAGVPVEMKVTSSTEKESSPLEQRSNDEAQKSSAADDDKGESIQQKEELRKVTAPTKEVTLPWHTHKFEKVNPIKGWECAGGENSSAEMTWIDSRTCCLCHISGDDDAGVTPLVAANDMNKYDKVNGSGRLLPLPGGGWMHAGCAVWSSEVWENPIGGILSGTTKAKSRSTKLRCFGCGQTGATLGCHRSVCNANFHYPCAKACGVAFTTSHKLYCKAHSQFAKDELIEDFSEPMKILRIVDDKMKTDPELCYRSGTLVIHSLGKIEKNCDGFHSKQYITPPGFSSTRIFWSFVKPKTRTVYVMRIVRSPKNTAMYTATAADAPTVNIRGESVTKVYNDIMKRVTKLNRTYFSHGDLFSVFPMARSKNNKNGFCLNGPQFFGFGVNFIREALETSSRAVACAVPLTNKSIPYQFCFQNPSEQAVMDLQRERAVIKAEKALENVTGCARTEGDIDKSKGSGRITRALVRRADEDHASSSSKALSKGADTSKVDNNTNFESIQAKYREIKSVPMEVRLAARRSHIHGWGLFAKQDYKKNSMIAEYMGEGISQPIADKREKKYEVLGMGSCYMFRLDFHEIVDATQIGCMSRFMNHCCRANAYANVISVNTDKGLEKKIVVFANQDIKNGDEITYDYKFPVEDGSLRCTCGAPNCIGRMN